MFLAPIVVEILFGLLAAQRREIFNIVQRSCKKIGTNSGNSFKKIT